MNQSYSDAISGIESGGRYNLLGPVTHSGDRAYGRFQVMGQNIPSWTQEVLGRSMTPQEFLASPQAQDAVFNAKFGSYIQKYGPEGAARAWFAGPGGMNDLSRKDVLGTSVGAYGRKFMTLFNGQPPIPPAPIPNLPGSPLDMAYFAKAHGVPDLPLFSAPQQQAQPPNLAAANAAQQPQAAPQSFFSMLSALAPQSGPDLQNWYNRQIG